jgi:hypothetical protein
MMSRNKEVFGICLVILLMLTLSSCGAIPTTMGSMSAKQNAAWMNNVYSRQYDLYLDQILKGDISSAERLSLKGNPRMITQDMLRTKFSEDEAKVLKMKKEVFETVYPLLMSYNEFIKADGQPPVELEYQIVSLINRLLLSFD